MLTNPAVNIQKALNAVKQELELRRCSQRTIYIYVRHITRFIQAHPQPLESLSQQDAFSYLHLHVKKGFGSDYINQIRAALCIFFVLPSKNLWTRLYCPVSVKKPSVPPYSLKRKSSLSSHTSTILVTKSSFLPAMLPACVSLKP